MAHMNQAIQSLESSLDLSQMENLVNEPDDETEGNRKDSDSSNINSEIYTSIVWHNGMLALSYYDLGTCQVYFVPDTPENDDFTILNQVLREIHPVVIILSSRQDNRLVTYLKKLMSDNSPSRTEINNELCKLEFLMNSDFNYEVSKRRVLGLNLPSIPKHYTDEERKMYFSSLLAMEKVNLVRSLGGLLRYLDKSRVGVELDDIDTQVSILGFRTHDIENHIQIDTVTYSALNIFSTEPHPSVFKNGTSSKEGLSLFGILNRCKSTSGSRKLRYWFLRPLKNVSILNERFDAISYFLKSENKETVNCLQGCLKNIKYITKVFLRMSKAQATVGDWNSLFKTLLSAVSIGSISRNQPQSIAIFKEIGSTFIEDLNLCTKLISKTIDFPSSKQTGKIVVLPNVNAELDEKKRTYNGMSSLLNTLSYEEIKSLRVDIDKCCVNYYPQLGFLLVINMPEGQAEEDDHTIEGLEFKFCSDNLLYYKTPKMAELDNILGDILASITDLEIKIIHNLQLVLLEHTQVILDVLDKIADLDCLLVLSSCASEFNYVRPHLVQDCVIDIKSGRHPLQELCCSPYVPNDANMGGEQSKMKLLTGPNACGKSVYLKQVALIVFMAHIGSFVPAELARIGPIDKIFTRLKSVESISEGMSTFLQDNMQMSEALRSATAHSLVVIDEYGKGTESTDGLALLTAMLKFWIEKGSSCPLVIVSTHFHSIIQQKLLPKSKQLQFLTLETLIQMDELVFLYQIKEGHTSSSYACNIAAVVGMAPHIVKRGQEVSDLISQHKNVPHMKDKHSKEQKIKYETIVTEFLKLNLDLDDIQSFLKNIVLPLADTSSNIKTGAKISSVQTIQRHFPSKISIGPTSSVMEVHTDTSLPQEVNQSSSSRAPAFNVGLFQPTLLQNAQSNVHETTAKTQAGPNTDSIVRLNSFCDPQRNTQHLNVKLTYDGSDVLDRIQRTKEMKDILLDSKLDCSFLEKSCPHTVVTEIKETTNPIENPKSCCSKNSGAENQTTKLSDSESTSSEKRKVDLRFLFKASNKKPRLEQRTSTPLGWDETKSREEQHTSTPISWKNSRNPMSITAIKKEKLSTHPSTCSGTIPEDSSETSEYSHKHVTSSSPFLSSQ
ncbi:mutS protein homolog 5-like [Biomphalaria glabrata]|uniref:MutS protein homolog 5-like n=1 Tax=Biomphalaria glabrata TaxID=6526 RepID=A0A9W3AD23_BIOGL|nr:mutS protein homolog 5-like [Biomphalaria glabrata]XP_055885196.1 mutS protein homolog 5-like [Biomphalaria glabrata]